MARLTKRVVEAAEPRGAEYFIWDEELKGFGLRVMPTGHKAYLIQYRAGGRTRRVSLSRVGVLTPDEARAEARDKLASVAKGGNPSEERGAYRRSATVAEASERFLSDHVAVRCKPSTQAEYRRCVEHFIVPALGPMKVADVKRSHVADLHHAYRHIPYQANRTLGVVSKLFNLAEVWGWRPDGSNPCRHVPKYAERKRERFLSPAERERLGAALTAAENEGRHMAAAVACFRLLLLTGCRLSEIQTLQWAHVRVDGLYLPDSKTGARRVPLSAAAKTVLDALPRVAGNPHVIPGKVPGSHLADLQHPWQTIRAAAGIPDVRIHDLRHSFASDAAGAGLSLPLIGKLLGHSTPQSTARYAHLADDPLQRAAEAVADGIARTLAPRSG